MQPNATPQLKVNNPCPFVPTNRTQQGCNHFCKSCSKTIIDFRGKTTEEIVAVMDENTCGIFTNDQLPAQQPMKWKSRPMFYAMMAASFLGFSVKPAYGQTQTPDTLKQNQPANQPVSNPAAAEKMKALKVELDKMGPIGVVADDKRKRVFKTVGCPSF